MVAVLTYITSRFSKRFIGFFEHWYIFGTRFFWSHLSEVISSLDGNFAVFVTVRHLFEPLYQDRTVIGYILGFIFRVSRVLIGISIYSLVVIAFTIFYGIWILVPVLVLYKIAQEIFL